jgi:hypothetical protein
LTNENQGLALFLNALATFIYAVAAELALNHNDRTTVTGV